jgi:hypothetical protein
MKAILLPNGRLLIPRPPEGPAVQEIGPEHPDFARWLATAEPEGRSVSHAAKRRAAAAWERRCFPGPSS